MKKILLLVVVSILVLSCYQAVAITKEKSEALKTEQQLQGKGIVIIKGGFGITTIVISKTDIWNTGFIGIRTECHSSNEVCTFKLPEFIKNNQIMIFKTGIKHLIFGFGWLNLWLDIYWDDDDISDAYIDRDGYIFGPFILITPIIYYF